ncbi:hypothetical protein PCH70_18020 [Pseudomonas cichorii JBC1]|nr:hypothetical protein PCH70_18020 [Pseudomonas cichorii JBC1]
MKPLKLLNTFGVAVALSEAIARLERIRSIRLEWVSFE